MVSKLASLYLSEVSSISSKVRVDNFTIIKGNIKLSPYISKKFTDSLPSNLLGSHEDISSCFDFIVNSPFTNGETITIDGYMG